jgi:ASC-1-like (ASCH) protein
MKETSSRKRLFVPLSTEPFLWFQSGKKRWELRKYGRQYTEQHITLGRTVELRKGYSRKEDSIWGIVSSVERAHGLEEFFRNVPYKDVIPTATDLDDAISAAARILGIHPKEEDVIGFKVEITR